MSYQQSYKFKGKLFNVSYKVYLISKLKLPNSLNLTLDELGLSSKELEVVLVKPNICGLYPPDLKLLKALLDYVVEISELTVIGETESTMYKPKERFLELGITNLVNAYSGRVRVSDLSEGDKVKVNVLNPRSVRYFRLPKLIFDADYIVNLARIGSHPSTIVTAALKNLFGLVAEKFKYFKYHPRGIDKVIADVAKVIKPNLNIVEVSDKVLVSDDALAVDIIATRMFGVNPLNVKHFRMVAEDRGEDLKEVVNEIEVINTQSSNPITL